ncbi:DUF418 domain-containing protein [Deinococcus cavernae]|uniref:DUF418 domain-containing protein n=2 Tax=Deinococcus cavernae TaxID=2320857 RepID=A0A418VCK0_9DEIO|nr:DUF418 domain-containing protein [Deinococcus cavernae]
MQDFAGFRVWRQSGLDGIAQTLTDVLANGRFISIFAMLFGWGAAGLLARHGAGLFVKRHLILLLIGSLHFVLVWHGDIISNYALLGLSLLLFGSLGVRALLGVAGVSGGWWLVEKSLDAARSFAYQPLPRSANLPDLAPGITYPQVLSERAREFLPDLLGGSLYNGFWLLALFCLGAAAYQTGLLTRPQQHVPLLRRLAVWGTLAGGILGVWLAYLNTRADFASALLGIPVRMGGGLAGALGYVGIIGLLTVQGRLGWLKQFANSGRIAMSNYLAQSLVMTTLFYPYAGAQWSKWGAASTLALALAFSAGQVWLSGLIVQRYGSGPMEKLVRRLVYGSRGENHA